MLNTLRSANLKTQMLFALIFFLGYFSPLLAILIFLFVKIRHMDMMFGKVALWGAALALILYAVDYAFYLYA